MARGASRAGIFVVLVVAACAAPAAHAATLTVDRETGTVSYLAAPGEANHVAIGYDAARAEYTVRDAGAPIALGTGTRNTCRGVAGVGAACLASRVTALSLDLGDLDDTLTADVDLALSIAGGSGADTISCGRGAEVVAPDPFDRVDPNCGTTGGNSSDGGDDASAPDANGGGDRDGDEGHGLEIPTDADGAPIPAPDLVLPVRPVTLGTPGIVEVQLGCAAAAAAASSGDIYVEAPARAFVRRRGSVRAARGRHSLRQRRLGHRRFRIEQGKTATTRVPVLRGHYVMRNRRKRVRGRVLVVQRDATGKVLGTTSRPVVLERKWSRRGKSRRRR